jgi:hypothetical protein
MSRSGGRADVELIPYLLRTPEFTAAKKRLLAEWKDMCKLLLSGATRVRNETFVERCMQLRSVPLAILDHVLQWIETGTCHASANKSEMLAHVVRPLILIIIPHCCNPCDAAHFDFAVSLIDTNTRRPRMNRRTFCFFCFTT